MKFHLNSVKRYIDAQRKIKCADSVYQLFSAQIRFKFFLIEFLNF